MNLETYFPYQLALAAELFSRELIDVYGHAYGLTREEWRLLLLLADACQLTSRELSQRTTLDSVQVCRAAQKLEKKGLILRTTSSSDRRLRVYTCSEAGQVLFSEIFPKIEDQANAIIDNMATEDQKNLISGIDALVRAIRAHSQQQLKNY